MASVKEIDALLPQTQCTECGYPGCLPYAEALAQGVASIDKCPPGGIETLKGLSALLGIDPSPYLDEIKDKTRAPSVAFIRESECIGCMKCIKACPVDAIVGGAKWMHSVINHECTGCGLCVEPCPVDCIDMLDLPTVNYDKDLARKKHRAKQVRTLRDEHEQQQLYREKSKLASNAQDIEAKQRYIMQALERAKAKQKR